MAGGRTQKNKEHKTRFSSKSQRTKHKIEREQAGGPLKGKQGGHIEKSKEKRLLRSKQVRDNKRAEVLAEKRSSGGPSAPPRILVLIGLSSQVNLPHLKATLLAACQSLDSDRETVDRTGTEDISMVEAEGGADKKDSTAAAEEGPFGCTTVTVPRYKMRLTVFSVDREDLLSCLEAIKLADVIAFAVPAVLSPSEGSPGAHIDKAGSLILSIARAQGLPSVVGMVQGLKDVPPKREADTKKSAIGALTAQFPSDFKVFLGDSVEDCQQCLRHLSEHRLSPPTWRSRRPYVAAHQVDFIEKSSEEASGTLRVSGYLRGRGISVNQLVHVAGLGDFQLGQIDGPDDPCPLRIRQRRNGDANMEEVEDRAVVLVTANPSSQEPLVRENAPDPLAGEQTWPTEEEMKAAGGKRRVGKMVPKGTSAYQSAWYIGDEGDEGEDDEGKEEEEEEEAMATGDDRGLVGNAGGEKEGEGEEGNGAEFSDEEWEEVDEKGRGGMASRGTSVWGDDHVDAMEEDDAMTEAQREADRQRLKAAHQVDQEFPDEVDTPTDMPARQRFAKYRGLKSFRSSPWDPYESLPLEYSRIFSFENFKRTQKHALARAAEVDKGIAAEGNVSVGNFVRLHIIRVPRESAEKIINSFQKLPLVVSGLLQHEAKMSVLHFAVRKAEGYKEPIKSKEPLMLHYGFRRYSARPIFSTDDLNADKHKFERFLHPGRFCIASVFAPVAYPSLPLLAFKEDAEGQVQLAASGSLRETNPDRVILKKIVLSGYPLSVSKRKAVVKYLFHNADDVRWFKPVELYTKYGRRGRIREPVGEKGNMKCIFDGVLQQRDAVCLNLYKRVYPKWPQP